MQTSAAEYLRVLTREYGDVVRYENPFGPVYFFNHPNEVQSILVSPKYVRVPFLTLVLGQGLLASDGDWWRQQRRTMQPHFHERCLPAFAGVVTAATEEMLARWAAQDGPVDLAVEMRRLALEVILQSFFSQSLGDAADEFRQAFAALIADLGGISASFFNLPATVSPERNARFQGALATVNRIAHRLIRERREAAEPPRDLMTMLMLSGNEEQGLSDEELRDEIVTLIIAGHEATAITLIWMWSLLERHPAVEERLRAEVAGIGPPSAEDLAQLSYTRMVLEETMRLYPSVWFMMRRATEAGTLAGCSFPAGAVVLVSPYTTHRHPEIWPEPDRFDPERFSAEQREGRHRFAYLPFSGGRHQCLGLGFAMMEMPLIVATILRRCRLRVQPGYDVEPSAGLTLRPRGALWAEIEWPAPTAAL